MNYIDGVRERLNVELPGLDPALLDLYTLLVFTEGPRVGMENVHDAWSVWRSRTEPHHVSVVPFDDLTPEVQELDRKYTDAIGRVARELL